MAPAGSGTVCIVKTDYSSHDRKGSALHHFFIFNYRKINLNKSTRVDHGRPSKAGVGLPTTTIKPSRQQRTSWLRLLYIPGKWHLAKKALAATLKNQSSAKPLQS
jgi:hypothetical protein